jgi:hypothetical protein
LNLDIAISDKIIGLLDTGSKFSLIKKKCLKKNVKPLKEFATDLIGINNKSIKTLGSILGTIKLGRKLIVKEFQVIPDNTLSNIDLLIGMNILQDCDILNSLNKLKFSSINEEVPLFQNKSDNNTTCFIEPRVEKIIKVKSELPDGEYYLEASEIAEKVFVPHSIIQCKNNIATVCAINISEEEISLDNIKNFKVQNLANYNHIKLTDQENSDRNKRLGNLIDTSYMNKEEKDSILKLCYEYNHIFHLEGDKFSHTDAVEHEINLKNDNSISQKPYRVPFSLVQEYNKQIKDYFLLINDCAGFPNFGFLASQSMQCSILH